METLPSDSRQPPDGHEFPDYVESSVEQTGDECIPDYYDLYDKESNRVRSALPLESVNFSQNRCSFDEFEKMPTQSKSSLNKFNSASNSDLRSINSRDLFGGSDKIQISSSRSTLHTRSQSLVDMSVVAKHKNDRWSLMAEQRRKGFSKLKGLVIPEHVTESDSTTAINIPEIISRTASPFVLETEFKRNNKSVVQCHSLSDENESVAFSISSPLWTSNTSTIPKYSPAFKRKSLQLFHQTKNSEHPMIAIDKSKIKTPNEKHSTTLKQKLDSDEFCLDNLSDSPKSLESITSPTRSDCSFDYITNSFNKLKCSSKQEHSRTFKEHLNHTSKLHKDIGKFEDESDNDSAVSSSQSSYISKCSPPPSPTRSCEILNYESVVLRKSDTIQDSSIQSRLLKAASVEAINRKNILASAKCRSGRDLKVGSPIIQRRYDDDNTSRESSNSTNQFPVTKEENYYTLDDIQLESKVRVSYEEDTSKTLINGNIDVDNNQKDEVKASQRNNLITLKPVSGPVRRFPTHLKDIKSHMKTTYVKPSSLLKNQKSMSVTDLRKSFEKFGATSPSLLQNSSHLCVTKETKTENERKSGRIDHIFGNKSKQNGETNKSLVSPIQKSTDEVLVDSNNRTRKVTLCPAYLGGSIGITLAGGTDYETKEITVHKIRHGSVAYNDGNLKKGDRIISINGKSTEGITHAQSVEMLKESVPKFVLIVEDGKEEILRSLRRKHFTDKTSESKSSKSAVSTKTTTHTITLTKEKAGLGFSIEGGKDSPQGDLPLCIKKIFLGGSADKNGKLKIGDELLAINDINLTNLSRIEVWSLMKRLPDGDVSIQIHR